MLFLIDDLLEDISFAEGEAYNEKLILISRGHALPDRKRLKPWDSKWPLLVKLRFLTGSVAAEYIIYDLWESMRAHDKELVDEVLEPTFTFMRAQTDRVRLEITELGRYLEYREKDVGKAWGVPCLRCHTRLLTLQAFSPP